MAYSTSADLQKWLEPSQIVELATDDATKQITDEEVVAVIDEVIASADSLINSYCLDRWPGLPSESPVPDQINQISCRAAIYFLFERRNVVPEGRRLAYEDCEKQLKLFADGKISLGLSGGGRLEATEESFLTDASSDYIIPEDDQRVYTPDKLSKL